MQQQLILNPTFKENHDKINAFDSIFLIGSCFSTEMYQKLKRRKFDVLSNPYGILFDTLSISRAFDDVKNNKTYQFDDIVKYKDIYLSWNHHSDFNDIESQNTIEKINYSICNANQFLKKSKFVIITLGSAFSYRLVQENLFVANCHKYPQNQFEKILISIEEIENQLINIINNINSLNAETKIIFTISPVRHLRDGIIENNKSKSRLIEALTRLQEKNQKFYYFPAYEIVIDVLRDYRFFDIDFAHPNYLATEIVFDYFKQLCIEEKDFDLIEEMNKLYLATQHKTKNIHSEEHQKFIKSYKEKIIQYQKKFPNIDFTYEKTHFES
jgi:hypothetical protein